MLVPTAVSVSDDPANIVFVRYSGAIYNRWNYDPATGRYLRYADTQNDLNRTNEAYAQLTDRLTSLPVAAITRWYPRQSPLQ